MGQFAVPQGCGVGADAPKTPEQLIATRKNPVYAAREVPNTINMLGYRGGRPYVDERLTRFPAESSISWAGSDARNRERRFNNGIEATGRKQRAYVVNNCARIAEKIRQYVFQTPPKREGADSAFVRDANRMGQGVNTVMGEVCNYVTVNGWSWLGIDAPRMTDDDGNPIRPTLAQQRAQKLRIYWNAYSALQVPDWHIDESGNVQWLITEGVYTDSSDPMKPPVQKHMRRLWQPGQYVEVRYDRDNTLGSVENIETFGPFPVAYNGVPFVLAGTPSPLPWWFDDVEAINRAIMDLESANDEAYFRSVYPQLILPASMIDELIGQADGGADIARKVEAIIGYDSAIAEKPEDKGITRYVMPPDGALGTIQTELQRKRDVLYETVGMALKAQSAQVESAEAKAWANLDAQAVLREKAQGLQEAEEKAIEISAAWDGGFKVYQPEYARSFDVGNIHEEIKSLVSLAAIDVPDEVKRLEIRAIADRVAKMTDMQLTQAEKKAIEKSIMDMDFMEQIPPMTVDAPQNLGEE